MDEIKLTPTKADNIADRIEELKRDQRIRLETLKNYGYPFRGDINILGNNIREYSDGYEVLREDMIGMLINTNKHAFIFYSIVAKSEL